MFVWNHFMTSTAHNLSIILITNPTQPGADYNFNSISRLLIGNIYAFKLNRFDLILKAMNHSANYDGLQ